MTMALQVLTDLMALVWQHPFLSGLILVLFTPPFFPIVKYFSPLLISTALFMLALFTMGPKSSEPQVEGGENSEFRRAADVKVWEDKSVADRGDGERSSKRRKADGSWVDWLKNIEESSLSWVDAKLKNENWKGSALNDDNVSILQEARWVKPSSGASTSAASAQESGVTAGEVGATTSSTQLLNQESIIKCFVPALIAPSELFKVESGLREAAERMGLGEDAPELEAPAAEPVEVPAAPDSALSSAPSHGLVHPGMENLLIPKRVVQVGIPELSPGTDLDELSDLDTSKRFMFANVRKNSINANSGLSITSGESDVDTPVAIQLSKSGKLLAMENLGDMMEIVEKAEQAGKSPELRALKATTAEEVQDVKEKLESFVLEDQKESSSHDGRHEEREPALVTSGSEKSSSKPADNAPAIPSKPDEKSSTKPGSPLFKELKGAAGKRIAKKSTKFSSDDESSSDEEELSDSDSDSEFEIFPPIDPSKIKLHPPVKLDIQQLEKKFETPLQQRATTRATSSKGEITEVQ